MTSEKEYWEQRRKQLLAQQEDDEAKLIEKLSKIYETKVAELERDIASYYQRYGEDNVIQYRRLMVDLSEADRRLLFQKMEDFAKKYPQYAHLLPVRASIYKLNELEGIQTAIRLQQLEIGAIEQSELEDHFLKMAQRAANLAAEELGFGSNFYNIDSELVVETVGDKWAHDKAFSETIWDNREKLAAYLNDDFARAIASGQSYDKCASILGDRFASVTSNSVRRLVFTEGTFLFNEAQARVHSKDFECYALSCADSRACEICRAIQAEQKSNPARFSDREPGVNFPPMHPWCRCSYTVEVEDWDAWIDDFVAKRGGDAVTPPYLRYSIPGEIQDVDTLSKYSDVVFGTQISGKCDVDIASMREVMEAIEDIKNKVPELNGIIKNVMLRTEADFIDQGSWNKEALAGISSNRHDTILLGDYFANKSYADLSRLIENKYKDGWFSTGNISGIIKHESGHAACHAIADKHPEIWLNYDEVARDIITKSFDRWKRENQALFDLGIYDKDMRRGDFAGLVSEYANKNDHEAIAESFAFVMENGSGGGAAVQDIIFDETINYLRM